IECDLVGQIDRRQTKAPFVAIAAEEIIVSDGKIKKAAWGDARRIVIVVLGSRSGNRDERRSVLRGDAGRQRRGQRWPLTAAEESCLHLLIGRKPGEVDRGCRIRSEGNGSGD